MKMILDKKIIFIIVILISIAGIYLYINQNYLQIGNKEISNLSVQSNKPNKTSKKDIHLKDTLINSEELVYNFEFYLPKEIEDWYNENYEKKINSNIWTIGKIFKKPDNRSEIIGELITYYDTIISNFVIQLKTVQGEVKREYNEFGDWGYGIHINTIAFSDNFTQLPIEYFDETAWINSKEINGFTSSYVGEIVNLSRIVVNNRKTDSEEYIENGNYFIESFKDSSFIIRREIPEDMPCGNDTIKTKDIDKITRYYLRVNELKEKNGDYRIEKAYPRGC